MTVRTALLAHVCLPTREKTPERLGAWEAADASAASAWWCAQLLPLLSLLQMLWCLTDSDDGSGERLETTRRRTTTDHVIGPGRASPTHINRRRATTTADSHRHSPCSQHVHTATAAADDRHGVYKNHCGGLWSFYTMHVRKKAPLCFWF